MIKLLFYPKPKFGMAHWGEPSENDRNDPYNPDQESTMFRLNILPNYILPKNLLPNCCLPNNTLPKSCLPKNILPFDRHTEFFTHFFIHTELL